MWIDIDEWKGKAGDQIWTSDGSRMFEALVVSFGPGTALQNGYFTTLDGDTPLPACFVWTGLSEPLEPPPYVPPPSNGEIDLWIRERIATGKALTNALRSLLLLQRPSERIFHK